MKQPLIITKLQLERAARRAGCCRDFRIRILRARSHAELLDIYINGIRFCMHHDYPKVEYCKTHFDPTEYNAKGIYIDDNLEGKEPEHKNMIALGRCTGNLTYGDFLVRRIVCRHKAKFDITATDYAILMVDICDEAEVTIHAREHARVVAYHYGNAQPPKTDTEGDIATIKVQHRNLIKNN